jgi:uncharacterized membrane protein YphA (DoxX/SURF4 family)
MDEVSTKGKFFRRFVRPYVSLISRLVIGDIFIYAGIAKIQTISLLIDEIEKYRILPGSLAVAYGTVLPYVEVLLGVLLVLGAATRVSASVSGLLVVSFIIAKISAMIRGLDISVCSCLGPKIGLLLVHSLVIDFVILALTIYLILYGSEFFSLDSLLFVRKNGTGRARTRKYLPF